MSTWPSFYLVGAPKAGTTAIAEALEQHPAVYPAPVKEPNFFNTDLWVDETVAPPRLQAGRAIGRQHYAVIRDEATYRALYASAGAYAAVGDYSVNYLRSRVAPRAISERSPAAKIVAVLRNPVERAFSHFLMDRRIGRVNTTFERILDRHIRELAVPGLRYENYVQCGLYAEQLGAYIEVFGRANVLILFYDDLILDFAETIRRIYRHIGVPDEAQVVRKVVSNHARIARSPMLNFLLYRTGLKGFIINHVPSRIKDLGIRYYYGSARELTMGEREKQRLVEAYRADVARLERIVDRGLEHWLG